MPVAARVITAPHEAVTKSTKDAQKMRPRNRLTISNRQAFRPRTAGIEPSCGCRASSSPRNLHSPGTTPSGGRSTYRKWWPRSSATRSGWGPCLRTRYGPPAASSSGAPGPWSRLCPVRVIPNLDIDICCGRQVAPVSRFLPMLGQCCANITPWRGLRRSTRKRQVYRFRHRRLRRCTHSLALPATACRHRDSAGRHPAMRALLALSGKDHGPLGQEFPAAIAEDCVSLVCLKVPEICRYVSVVPQDQGARAGFHGG